MNIPRSTVNLILIVFFLTGVFLRVKSGFHSQYPYYKAESAVRYRYAYMIGQKGYLPIIDKKAAWPEGFKPSHGGAKGVEFFAGYLFKIANYFSDMGERKFLKVLTCIVSSLLIVLIYRISYNTWHCKAGGLLSATMLAISAPLIKATNGIEFSYLPYAAVLIALHLLLLQDYKKHPSPYTAVLASLASFFLLAAWDFAIYYIGISLTIFLQIKASRESARLTLGIMHFFTFIASAFLLPHMTYKGWIFSFPAALLCSSLIYILISMKKTLKGPGIVYLIGGALVIRFFFSPFISHNVPSLASLVYWRLRYLLGKPWDPSLLPMNVRIMWNLRNSYAAPYEVISLIIPFVFLIPPFLRGLRMKQKEGSAPIREVLAIAVGALALYLMSGSTLILAAMALVVLFSPAFYSFRRDWKSRFAFMGIAFLLLFIQAFQPQSRLNSSRWVAKAAGVPEFYSRDFTQMSIGNADVDLVRFLVSHTSVRDPFLSAPRIAPMLVTFAGRTTTLIPGVTTLNMHKKIEKLMGGFFLPERDLYDICKEIGIKYVVYSIDILLDTSNYSPSYLVGIEKAPKDCAAFYMHFSPEGLNNFNLIYENDNYRVFKVVDELEPIFLNDHPPVYQQKLFIKNNSDFRLFYDRIITLLSMYALARNAQSEGDYQKAANFYNNCVREAPMFTQARLGLGSSLFAMGKIAEAKTSFVAIIAYAPDNTDALYAAALTMYKLGEMKEAGKILEILISTSRDRDMLKKARGLRQLVRKNMAKESPADPQKP